MICIVMISRLFAAVFSGHFYMVLHTADYTTKYNFCDVIRSSHCLVYCFCILNSFYM